MREILGMGVNIRDDRKRDKPRNYKNNIKISYVNE